ncbi:5-formyltetrahydrofolate cyclo-ligase [Methyloversatilis sp. RAC08]|uniref:5-formyltetrahydrofolate cyclo-ligase n=1 Tax=Methyloversatilis sp. RAC08 TaxID=1842540 RepID=UPI00083CB73A|nr:5-formyltetrahydrofolate cyclo-ligase [Methyloversatilis sp. RAC08]AOF82832.1 5-formyltetrahydrofolate cyclo-ligase [Methyloversatilis sp. RAC08]
MDAQTDLPAWRRTERQRLIAAREGLSAEQRAARNGVITALLEHGFPVLRRLIIGFCWPYRGEFDARFVIRTLRSAGARAALPDVVARATPLVFREWWPGVAMTKRVFDLPVPDGTAIVQPQALLIPLVGFDACGYRLGYGGGYFDRTLAAQATQPLRIGVGFESSRMPTIHPQPHDVAMDFIVTEAGIHVVTAGGLQRIDASESARCAQALIEERFPC